MTNLLQSAGAQPQKAPKYVPIFIDRAFTGIYTQRSVLHDPSDIATARFYGGRPDALWQGSNIELTNRLTLQRRPGLTPFSSVTYPTPPDRAFSFELTDGTIQVIVDTGNSPSYPLSAVNVISGVAFYLFKTPQNCAANNSYVNLIFNVTGFDNQTNNGAYTCTGSTSSYLILTNPSATNDVTTSSAFAITAGAVYFDPQSFVLPGVTFDGTSGQIGTTASPTYPSKFSVEAWIRTNNNTGNIIELNDVSGSGAPGATWAASLGISTGMLTLHTSNTQVISGGPVLSDNEYHYVVGSYDGTTASLYVDGVQVASEAVTATSSFSGFWRIGNGATEGNFAGTISNVAAYISIPMTSSEILNHYNTMINDGPAAYEALVEVDCLDDYWPLNETSGSIFVDVVTGRTGTGTGGFLVNQSFAVEQEVLLFAKSAGAGQTGFVAVAGTLYMGDGVDTRKYTPMNTNGTIWNYSIAAPTAQPDVTTVESGSAAVAWQASTFFSTMGLLVDSNGNIEFLTGVNNTGTNTTQFGTTGQGQPVWSNVTGVGPSSGEDGTCNWLCAGPLTLWTANTKITAGTLIYVPGVGGTPLPSFPEGAGNSTGKGINCSGTTGGGIWQTLFSLGTTGTSKPKWNPVSNTATNDNGILWQYIGPALLWQPLHIYNSWWEHLQMCIVEPTLPNLTLLEAGTQQVYVQTNNNSLSGSTNTQGTSGTGYTPPWPAAANTTPDSVGQTTGDGDLQWICLGWGTWLPSTEYVAWSAGATQFSAIEDGNGNFQVALQGGLSAATIPFNGWVAGTHYALNAKIAVKSSTGLVEFNVTISGTTGASEPSWNFTTSSTTTSGGVVFTSLGPVSGVAWGLTYGSQTDDGGVVWTNVGSAIDSTWKADIQWFLPTAGFTAPSSSQAYGGAEVIANGDVQIVISSGLSGSSMPAWGVIGTTTQDNQAIWYTDAAQSVNSLSWTSGYVYAYSYKARSLTDFYSVPSFVPTGPGQTTFTIPIPPGQSTPLINPPPGSQTGGISTASPVFTITGPNAGAVNFVKVTGSLDDQVSDIVIWRSADGGGADNMFELTEIPNPLPVNGAPGVVTFADYLPDVAQTTALGVQLPGLNELIPAPIADANDPPLSNFIPMVYNFQRIWGAAGQEVLWSGGPDTLAGNSAEAYNPSDNFPFLANVTRVIKNSQGLVIFLTDSVEFIGGGPSTNSFYAVSLSPGIGMNSFNAADIYAGEIVFFSSDSQLKSINPSLQLMNLGFAIGDQLALLDSSEVYVAYQQSGVDNAVYVGDGSTGWWRLNPHQIPGGPSGNEAVWSPFANITGGAGMVQSVETSPGIKKLLVGGTSCNQPILERNLGVFSDNGVAYPAFFVMGAMMLAEQGQLAVLKHVAGDFSLGITPQMSYLIDEISGQFTTITNPVQDPPSQYGTTLSASSYQPLRWYFSQTGQLARCRHIQLRVDFPASASGDEMLNLDIFGKIMVET